MQWSVVLDPVNSGEVCEIGIVNLENIIVLEDILFGDVWFCSGQSNMGWAIKGTFLEIRNFLKTNMCIHILLSHSRY